MEVSSDKPGRHTSNRIPIAYPLDSSSLPGGVQAVPEGNGKPQLRLLYLSLQAIFNAILIGLVAKGLIALISFFTNISFYGIWSFKDASPGIGHLGWLSIFIPVAGGLVVGLMARYGSAGIRGHGIPEAMEQVLRNESRIQPIITLLKPLSSAIAIGTGGPFGAEGPIIATGGAMGSLAGQIMRISPQERKIMLAAGAAAGMSATFGSPVSGILMALELLLFEFSPRALIPVALSSCTGAACHFLLFSSRLIFEMPILPYPGATAIVTYTLLGIVIGVAAAFVSKSVYYFEDQFSKLPIHWMWWPALGGIGIGVIGYFAPKTMGVGYSNIDLLLTGSVALPMLLALSLLKFLSWSSSLGSGTSGGTLAPLFTIGGALGGLLGMATLHLFPESGINLATASLVGMAALFAGSSRAFLTSVVFALETTGQLHDLLPLLGGCASAYFVSFFLMKGSIMTMKIQRDGFRIPDSFEPDLFQVLNVRQAMKPFQAWFSPKDTLVQAREQMASDKPIPEYSQFFLCSDSGQLLGCLPRSVIWKETLPENTLLESQLRKPSVLLHPEMPLSEAIAVMDLSGENVFAVVEKDESQRLMGLLSYWDVLHAYERRKHQNLSCKREISLKLRGLQAWSLGRRLFSGRGRQSR